LIAPAALAEAEEAGLPAPSIMQSSGGLTGLEHAAGHAAVTVLSGPAGGAGGAAFVAAAAGEQVAVLTPTTLLAEQHFNTFSDRFADWPVKLAELSRFRSSKENAEILKKLASGEADIVIGTHKLISGDVSFKKLGLVIIDEQHKFGVTQREKLVRKGSYPHLLVMTATPIPRTLGLTVYGELDVSTIDSLPAGRGRVPAVCPEESAETGFCKTENVSGRSSNIDMRRVR
jgi:RecG-like helicase